MRPIIAGFLLLAACGGALAQEDGPNVSLRINLVAWGEDTPGLKIGKSQEVTALAFRYSEPIKYSGPRLLEISRNPTAKLPPLPDPEFDPNFPMPNRPDETDLEKDQPGEVPKAIQVRREKNPELVALAQLPTDSRWVTILLAPGPGGTFQTYVIDDDPRKLPSGTLRIHNLSKQAVAMRCNRSAQKQLEYGDTMTVKAQKDRVLYELAYKKGEKWKMQEANILRVGPQEQVQFIVLQSNSSFFVSGSGGRTGFLQAVALRRSPEALAAPVDPAGGEG